MEINIFSVFSSAYHAFVASGFFYFLKIIAGFVIAILLIADILLLSKRLQGDWKVAVYGSKVPRLKKSLYTKRWEEIKKRLESESVSSGKIALIEADKMLGEVLEKVGYSGKDTGEKIAAVKSGQLEGIAEAGQSHEIYKKIVRDPSYTAETAQFREALERYEKVFRGLELLD